MNSEFKPEHSEHIHLAEGAGQLLDVAEVKIPCAICVLNAVRQGVDYQHLPPSEVVGQTYNGGTIHEAVTQVGGTDVCWYHADDAAKAVGL